MDGECKRTADLVRVAGLSTALEGLVPICAGAESLWHDVERVEEVEGLVRKCTLDRSEGEQTTSDRCDGR